MNTPSGTARIEWFDAAQRVWGTAEVYCAALADASGRRAGYWPSRVYVCPHCGSPWMWERWTHNFQYASMAGAPWQVVTRPCHFHGDGTLLGHLPLSECDDAIVAREARIMFDLLNQGKIHVDTDILAA